MATIDLGAASSSPAIDDVITRSEIDEITEGYRRTAGFALDDPRSLADRAY